LNLVERRFAEFTNTWLPRITHRSSEDLESAKTSPPLERRPDTSRLAAEEILDTLAAFCQRIPDSHH
jgi:hypothetical protein